MSKTLISIKETCHVLSVGKTTVYSLISHDRLDVCRIGGRTLVTMKSIERLVGG
ncbi:helix-turn-helix domain-containing protein [Sphingomonas aerolata]|uniref:helix-turn-helix domain-containing protein n=1 Tax=Sphingomonas aerolata TaxID=185951 RepID=UPI003363EFCD